MKKILVTGGAGFIGAYVVKTILEQAPSVSVVNLDKLTYSGDLSRLESVSRNPRYSFVRGDIGDFRIIEKTMRGCDGVIHLAAETHVDRSILDGRTFLDTNVQGTYVLLEAARKLGIQRFLFVSTDEVYGSCPKGFFKEGDLLNPSSPYSVSKTAADLLSLSYVTTYGLNVVVTRGANTYGPYQYPEKVVPLFVSNALSNRELPLYGDGKQVRNWIHVEDHARAIFHVFKKGKKGEVYNISSKNYLQNIELTRRILKILGKPETLIRPVKDRLGHDRRYAIDSSKLKKLGWKEKRNFDKAFSDTVLWYAKNEAWWKKIKEKNMEFLKYYRQAYRERDHIKK